MKIVIAAALLLVAPALAQSPAGEDDATALEPLVVTPGSGESEAELLRALLERSAPCLGCDARPAAAPRQPVADLLGYLLLPATPPEPDAASRISFREKARDAPDLRYLEP